MGVLEVGAVFDECFVASRTDECRLVPSGSADGEISEKREYVFTDWDPSATSDLEALRSVFDTNGEGKLTSADSAFASFKVMVTKADRTTTAKTRAQLGINEIGNQVEKLDQGSKRRFISTSQLQRLAATLSLTLFSEIFFCLASQPAQAQNTPERTAETIAIELYFYESVAQELGNRCIEAQYRRQGFVLAQQEAASAISSLGEDPSIWLSVRFSSSQLHEYEAQHVSHLRLSDGGLSDLPCDLLPEILDLHPHLSRILDFHASDKRIPLTSGRWFKEVF